MSGENYAYAVASVRVKELGLLSPSQMEQLLAAGDYAGAVRHLRDWGWADALDGDDCAGALRGKLVDAWALLQEVAPQPGIFRFLVLKNDYHNLKAAIKATLDGISPDRYYIAPSVYDPGEIGAAVARREFDALPDGMADTAREAYDVLARTGDGQLCDIIVDAATLAAIRRAGRESGYDFLDRLSELMCVSANLKTAARAAKTGKNEDFLSRALCECDTLDKSGLTAAAARGTEQLYAFIAASAYAPAVEALSVSVSAFEKWCDDLITAQLDTARYQFFGPEPLAAYYLAREAEVKSVRILLSGKRNGLAPDAIRERMRNLYV